MHSEFDCCRWYALQVKARWERSTAGLLSGRGYQTILPTFKTVKQSRRNSKAVISPLFPGYVFCRFDANNRLPVLITPGVVSVVRKGSVPEPVQESEIAAIERVVSSDVQAEPCHYLEEGQSVRIERGPLEGIEGILLNLKGGLRVVVSVSLLRRSVAIEIDRSQTCPTKPIGRIERRSFSLSCSPEPVIA
jgi:transcription termination/antitermination protein NusG